MLSLTMEKNMVYGFNPVLEAVRSGRAVKVFVSTGRKQGLEGLFDEAEAAGVPVERVPAQFFERLPKGHQSVAARVREKKLADIGEMLESASRKGELPLLVALDGVEDPRNLGAIMRSALAAGAHGIIVQKHRSAALGPEAYKASAGAAEFLPVSVCSNIKYALDELRDKGLLVAGAEAGGRMRPWDADLAVPLVLVMGGEDTGLRDVVAKRCDCILSLPLMGRISSLNVSVSAGVFLFEILRQRMSKKPK